MQLDWHVPTSSSSPRMTHTQALQSLSSLPKQSQECGDGVLHDGTWTGPHKDQHMLLCARKNRSTTKLCPEGYWWICPTKVRNWFHKGLIGFCNPLVRLVFTAVDYAAELVSAREHHCRLHRWQQFNPEHLVDVNKLPVELLLATFICTKAGRMDSSISLKYNICSAEQVSKVVVGNTAKTELLFLAHKLRFSNYMVQEILL